MTIDTLARRLLAPSLLALAAAAQAQTCAPVEVHHVRSGEGRLMLVAYDAEADFRQRPATAVQLRADAPTLQFQVCGLRGEAVALSVYQDLNGNGQLDTNALGMPGEPWGSSGTPPGFGPPSWATAQVPLDGRPIVVKLSK